MSLTLPGICTGEAHVLVVGDCGSPLAAGLKSMGNTVRELPPSDFNGQEAAMVDVVAVLPGCADAERVGAAASACARVVWFQESAAPPGLTDILTAIGVPVFEGRDLLEECSG